MAILSEKGGLEIGCDWPHGGRVRMFFPPDTTPEQRAEFFEEMARMERAVKHPLVFGDSHRNNPPETGAEKIELT